MLELIGIFGAGIATLATPCILPLVPIYLAMLLGGSVQAVSARESRWRLLGMTAAFSAGFTLVFSLLGLGASMIGGLLAEYRGLLTVVGGLLIVLFGLKFMGLFSIPWLDRDVRLDSPRKIGGPVGGFLFGVVFGLGWTPCAGPVLASVLSYAALAGSELKAAGLLALYSAGIALPLLALSAFADRGVPLLRRIMGRLEAMQRLTGMIMVGLGLFLGGSAAVDLWSTPSRDLVAVSTAGEQLSPLTGAPLPKPRLVELVEDDCPVCQRMSPRVQTLRDDCTEQLVDIHTVSLSDERNRGLRQRLAVRAVPTFLLVDDLGQVRQTLIGERSIEELRGIAAELQAMTCAGIDPIDVDSLTDSAGCDSEEGGDAVTGACS